MSQSQRWVSLIWVVLLILPLAGCGAKKQVKLEMTRETVLIEPEIQSVTVSPSGRIDTREGARTIEVRLVGDPGLQATFDVDGMFEGRTMTETEPGVYRGSFDVPAGREGTLGIVGHLLHPPTGAASSAAAAAGLVLYRSSPPQPQTCTAEMQRAFDEKLRALTVYFETDKAEVNPEGKQLLERNRDVLDSYPLCPILILAHADDRGSPRYNDVLTVYRAISVGRLLESLGIPHDRLEKHPMGARHPVATGDTEEARAKNRRAELRAVYPY